MSTFIKNLKLKEQAEEDIYFAKRDRELIEALHRKELAKHACCPSDKKNGKSGQQGNDARSYEKKFRKLTRKHRDQPRRLLKAYQRLLKRIRKKCHMG